MMKHVMHERRGAGGFTLIEMAVVLIILALLAGLAVTNWNASRSKGQVLHTMLVEYGKNMTRLALDTSCYPTRTGALSNRAFAANSFCGANLQAAWRGAYVKGVQLDGNGDILLAEIAPTSTMTINVGNNLNGTGNSTQWYLQADNVPADIATEALASCNKNQATGPCVASPNANGNNSGWIRYIFDERA